jgi:tRNA A-37 threonylcarbamoyl transferase component Bud32
VPEPVELTSGTLRWRLTPGALREGEFERLAGPHGPRLEEWLARGDARVVKAAPHRALYHVVLPGLDVHVKHYPAGGRRGWLRSLLRPSPARREYDRTLALAARGVPTLEVLAVGEAFGSRARDSYLITRTLQGTTSLDLLLESPVAAGAGVRQRLARALARLLARMHDAGLAHHDLHPGNVLVRMAAGGEPQLFLIDLHMAQLGRPLPWRAARDNLVVLNRWFHLRSSAADRHRFWETYREARPQVVPAGAPAREAARDLERRTLQSNLRFWRAHDSRCLGGNRHFRRFRRGPFVGHAVADLDDATLAAFLAGPDAPFAAAGARLLKDSPTSAVVELELPGPGGLRAVVYKRFAPRRALEPLAALARPTQTLRSYLLGHALRLRCLPTPRPLAAWHRCRAGLPHEGYLLTEKVPDALDLRTFIDRLGGPAARTRLRGLIDQVGRLLARMHRRRLSHRDLKAPNLLVSPAPALVTGRGIAPLPPGPPAETGVDQVWFIDLVGVRRLRRLRRSRKVRDVARLAVSFHDHPGLTRADRLRFLRAYLGWGLHGRHGWKPWWRQVEAATAAKVRRNQRAGRPLG